MFRCLLFASLTMSLFAQEPKPFPALMPPTKPGELPRDGKDQQPVLLGICEAKAILAHRTIFQQNLAKDPLPPALKARWKGLSTPLLLVVAFGSWCGDSQQELPDLLAFLQEPNPFIQVRLIGVYRDKQAPASAWPEGILPQSIEKVPTFWAYTLLPGGAYRLLGSIMETPPKPGQRMGEALLELLEKAE